MASKISNNILSSNVGVSGILPKYVEEEKPRLPDFSTFIASGQSVKNLEELFDQNVQQKLLRQAMTPHIDNPEQYDPGHINQCISSVREKLANIDDKQIQLYIRDVLGPLENNHHLLKACRDMMIGG